jgi:hypothetical protein
MGLLRPARELASRAGLGCPALSGQRIRCALQVVALITETVLPAVVVPPLVT